MPIDPSIYNMVGKFPQVEVPDPLERQTRLAQLKQLASQGQMTDMAMADAQAKRAREARAKELLTKNQGDIQKAAQEAAAAGDYETASEFQTLIKSRAQTDAVYQKSVSEAQEAYLKASKEERAAVQAGLEDLAKGIQWVEQGSPEELPARYARFVQHYPPQVREKYGMGPQYDPSIGGLIKARAQAWGDVSKSGGTPASAVGKIMEDYKRGYYGSGTEAIQLRDAAIKDATTKTPAVNVGLGAPVELTRKDTGEAVVLQPDKKTGKLVENPLYAPKGGSKPLTESQGNALGFGIRARESDQIMSELENKGVDVATIKNKTLGAIPGVGNFTKSPAVQQVEQAQRNFVTAVLRKESGAAISASEFETEAKKYFPQPGDSPAVRAQKANARKTAIEVLQLMSGRDLPAVVKPVAPAKPKQPSTGTAKKISSKAEYDALKSGEEYIAKDGTRGRKP